MTMVTHASIELQMTNETRNKLMPLATLFLFAVIIILSMRAEERIFQNNGKLEVRREGDAVVLFWKSGVDVPMARRFEEAFENWRYETDRFIIDLHSPGGVLQEGEQVIRIINRMQRSHQVDTRVRARRSCLSMCVAIFLQGEERIAAPNSRWMFHEPTARDFYTGEEINEPGFEKRIATDRFVDRYFVNSPMDPVWRDALTKEWRGKDIWKAGQALVDEGSGVVTRLE